ncbi:MAG TPA: DNA ligase D [Gammaproteobacteria bacterium]|nr:DNA ligase D [Gammaproteobacteria bacterium]
MGGYYILAGAVTTKNVGNLESYRAKRKADRTPEPFGLGLPSGQRFVVQQHAARRNHYDFRLEFDGVLKSWAVPKGPSPNPADKRLAVHVEDHPVDYVNFEGVIPKDNYGAGAVIVWDRGQWIALNDIAAGFDKGKLLFELKGHKLRGKWTLVKTKRGKNEWLLIKERDAYATQLSTEDYPHDSVLSGRTVEQVASGDPRAAAVEARLRKLGAVRRELNARDLRPMLATPGKPFSDPKWVFELKYDGYRLFAEKRGGEVKLYSRAGNDFTATFPEIADIAAALPFSQFIIDAEVVVLDARGLPSFSLLQKRGRLTRRADVARAALELPCSIYAFDLLAFDDLDLRSLPLLERKTALRALLPVSGAMRYSEHFEEQGEALFDEAERMGLEGIIGKRAASPYASKRSTDWIKVNAAKSDDFVVVGYLPPKQGGKGFGALLLGQYRDGELTYAGRAGSGFAARDFAVLEPLLAAKPKAEPPVAAELARGSVWIAEGPVVQVKFKQRTPDGMLRQPVYMRLRADKRAVECVWQSDADGTAAEVAELAPPANEPPERPTVAFTNLDKVFWPADGYTKGDMIAYYEGVAEWLLPYLKDRPVVLTRYPDGIDGKSFFQKDAPVYAPSWLRLETMWSEHAEREIRYFVLDDVESLLYVANMGTIPLHVWSSRVAALERPDWCILDLDPKGAPLKHVVEIARHLHALCEDVGLANFVKTSGSTGLHVLIPLGARYTYEQSRTLAELLARFAAKSLPEIATIVRSVSDRDGKVYVDFLQNGHGRLLVSPFCVRPLPGAPVSMPLEWQEINGRLKLERFNIRSARKWLAKHGDPLAPVLTTSSDMLAALGSLTRRLAEETS